MTGRLDGKVALITGSDSGIGPATAIEFAKEGADIVVTYVDDAEGAQQTQQVVEAAGQRASVVQADLREETQVATLFDKATAEFGTLHIMMNNAGVDAAGTKVAELSNYPLVRPNFSFQNTRPANSPGASSTSSRSIFPGRRWNHRPGSRPEVPTPAPPMADCYPTSCGQRRRRPAERSGLGLDGTEDLQVVLLV